MSAAAHASRASDAPHASIESLDGSDLDVTRLGGKAVSLNRLAQAGFRIPPGFCLTTDAFAAHVATIPDIAILAEDPVDLRCRHSTHVVCLRPVVVVAHNMGSGGSGFRSAHAVRVGPVRIR